MAEKMLLIALLATGGCQSLPAAQDTLTGTWGGQHVGLTLTGTGGQLDYDCAAGTIEGPLILQQGNRFAANGRHTPGTGGPEQVGQERPSFSARYSGSVRGEIMTLRVEVPTQGIVIGPYSLRRGAEPVLMRCL